ncbi:mitogen-activated protein kinase [Datura stramonium]|uniref:Mitogen-activated protein kinase n=1 Tax=Datura stramonium TaxID=4076 RepID=A0ABS8T742_DATST|nr:mitogen-activated protein kinase [Datura stramonium]
MEGWVVSAADDGAENRPTGNKIILVCKGLSKDGKACKLALQHWLEVIDPRHRYGHNLRFYYTEESIQDRGSDWKGSYGVVCYAYDTYLGEKVAIKKINNIFEHVSDATHILREIKLLRLLRHPDIVEIKHILLPPSWREFKDIYELMKFSLSH